MKFNKIFSLTLVFVIAGLTALAQPTFKIGATLADIDAPEQDLFELNPKANLFVGIHLPLNFSDEFGIEPGLVYQRMTTELSTPIANITSTRDFIALPVLLKFFPTYIFSFGGGIQASFLAKDSFKENFQNKDFTMSAQVQGTVTPIPEVGIEFGYNFGLTPYTNFESTEIGSVSFKNGNGRNKFYYLTLNINL